MKAQKYLINEWSLVTTTVICIINCWSQHSQQSLESDCMNRNWFGQILTWTFPTFEQQTISVSKYCTVYFLLAYELWLMNINNLTVNEAQLKVNQVETGIYITTHRYPSYKNNVTSRSGFITVVIACALSVYAALKGEYRKVISQLQCAIRLLNNVGVISHQLHSEIGLFMSPYPWLVHMTSLWGANKVIVSIIATADSSY